MASQVAKIRDNEVVDFVLVLAALNANIAAVNSRVYDAVEKSATDIRLVCKAAVDDVCSDERFQGSPLPERTRQRITEYREAVERDTGRQLRRLVRANNVSQSYQQTANMAVVARSSGLGDYQGQMRATVRGFARSGIRVTGEDNRSRSIVKAVKSCILNAIYEIRQYTYEIIGAELGFDAVEISVHENPAPDHEAIQGRVFLRSEYEKLQGHMPCTDTDGTRHKAQDRAIGELNCRHIAMPFSTMGGKRRFKRSELRKMIRRNQRGCTINGKHYTLYEAKQLISRLRDEKKLQENVLLAAEIVEDPILASESRVKIRTVEEQLQDASKAVYESTIDKEYVKHFEDITDKWFKDKTPGSHSVKDLPMVTVKGVTYHVHGTDVQFKYDQHEKEVAQMLSDKVGGEIYMLPKVNQPGGVRTADYMINGVYYDLKTIKNVVKSNTIYNSIKKAYKQTINVVLDITKGEVGDELLDSQISKVFWSRETSFVDELVIVKDMDILRVLKRKE